MFDLLTRFMQRRKKVPVRRARLAVEVLESRLCPFTGGGGGGGLLSLTLDAEVLPSHFVHLTGTATGDHPAGVSVTFSGALSGSATTDSSGNFNFTTDEAVLGTVYAIGVDQDSITSNTASDDIAVDAPAVTLNVVSAGTDSATLVVGVDGVDYAGLDVSISGALSDMLTTNSDGYVIFSGSLSASDTVEATVTDLWGQTSGPTDVYVTLVDAITPELTLNAQVQSAHTVVLTGTLSSNDPDGAMVTFSGAVTGSTRTDSYGNYTFTTEAASLGTVYATATDAASNTTPSVSADIVVDAPSLYVSVQDLTQNTVTVSGYLTALDPFGQAITLGGVASGTVITDASGYFTFTTVLTGTGTITASTTDLWGQASNTAEATVDTLPDITSPQIVLAPPVVSGSQVILAGDVIGTDVDGVTVTFSGAISGTTTTDASGHFTYTASSASLGVVYAVGTDSQQQSTNTAMATVAVAPPRLTFAISDMSGSTVTYSGKWFGADAGNQTITLGGDTTGTVTTDGDGNFSFTMDRSVVGTFTVAATDAWGQTSNTAAVTMPEHPPLITDFAAIYIRYNLILLRGRVTGDDVAGQTVTFAGTAALAGVTTTVRADGTFYLTRSLSDCSGSTVTATVTDQYGRVSNIAYATVV